MSSSDQVWPVFAAIFVATMVFTLAMLVVAYVVTAIALSFFFTRVGVEPWKAWVPVYGYYIWLLIGGVPGYWAFFSIIPYVNVVTSVFLYIGMYRSNIAFGKSTGFFVLGIFLPLVWLFMLGCGSAPYRPDLISRAGYAGPWAGHGAYPAGTPAPSTGYRP
ncbi:DUF5684 domain-containing protein [Glaciibacter superstes]|uniref:DUF5684 domain-containing protein n=1 Tax=Glaciibacter superstes TaxID=501023 RepID=UPI0003B77A74|nr:DUF5684 domain-containing protein [Glaciibacter superstes]